MSLIRRVLLNIQTASAPESIQIGYAIIEDLNHEIVAFFSTEKFKFEEELTLQYEIGGESIELKTRLYTIREHISSGRIMTAPFATNGTPPTRSFYRCYAQKLKTNIQSLSPQAPLAEITELKVA